MYRLNVQLSVFPIIWGLSTLSSQNPSQALQKYSCFLVHFLGFVTSSDHEMTEVYYEAPGLNVFQAFWVVLYSFYQPNVVHNIIAFDSTIGVIVENCLILSHDFPSLRAPFSLMAHIVLFIPQTSSLGGSS